MENYYSGLSIENINFTLHHRDHYQDLQLNNIVFAKHEMQILAKSAFLFFLQVSQKSRLQGWVSCLHRSMDWSDIFIFLFFLLFIYNRVNYSMDIYPL